MLPVTQEPTAIMELSVFNFESASNLRTTHHYRMNKLGTFKVQKICVVNVFTN